MIKKILALLLAACSVAVCFGCQKNDPDASDTTGIDGSNETDSPYSDDLPPLDFDGAAFRVLYPYHSVDDFFIEEPAEEVVDQAVYTTNVIVEERLNVEYQMVVPSVIRAEYSNYVVNRFLANADEFDIVGEITGHSPVTAESGAMIDLNGVKYFDFTKPYWLQSFVNGAAIDGHLYYIGGDAGISFLKTVGCMLYDISLAADYQIGNVQQLALEGGWTYEKLQEFARRCYSGADPNNVNLDQDTFGLVCRNGNHSSQMVRSAGVQVFTPNSDGGYDLTIGSEHAVDVVEFLVELFNDNKMCVGSFDMNNTQEKTYTNIFLSGRSLFISAELDDSASLYNEISGDFQVIPLPKWEEDDEYATLSRGTFISYGIMRTCSDPDFAGAVMECIASTSYDHIMPAYFETAMKVRYSDATEETKQTFDLIRNSIAFDYGYSLHLILGNATMIYDAIRNNNSSWMSTIASKKTVWMRNFDMYIEKMRDMESSYS